MITVTKKKVFAAAALIFATGASALALPVSPAQAMSLHGPGTPAYATSRILAAFDVATEMPSMPSPEPVRFPMATKGDLPIPLVCFGEQADAQTCADVSFKVPPKPSTVVETRIGNTSIWTRTDAAPGTDGIDEELTGAGA
jgi:hypothetical protein